MVKALELDVEEAKLSYLDQFVDKDDISEDLKPYVALAVEYGIMNGTGNNMFEPKSELTRAQACTLFARFIQNYMIEEVDEFQKTTTD